MKGTHTMKNIPDAKERCLSQLQDQVITFALTIAVVHEIGEVIILSVTEDCDLLCIGETVTFTRSQFENAVLQWAEETDKHYLPQPANELDREITIEHEHAAQAITNQYWADVPVRQDDAQLGILLAWAIESTTTY